MREILFRGKRLDNGEWVYGGIAAWKDGFSSAITTLDENDFDSLVLVYPETVGQYTGLTDKNGTKIFEGDFLHWEYQDYDNNTGCHNWIKHECKVTFEYGSFYIDAYPFHLGNTLDFDDGEDWRLEVIGNIHDNPELLKGGEE